MFSTCALKTPATFLDYPQVSDFPNFPAASSYYVLSQRSIEDGSCFAGCLYSTDDLVRLESMLVRKILCVDSIIRLGLAESQVGYRTSQMLLVMGLSQG